MRTPLCAGLTLSLIVALFAGGSTAAKETRVPLRIDWPIESAASVEFPVYCGLSLPRGAGNWDDAYMNCSLQRDPRYRLDGRKINPRDGVNPLEQGLDYAHPQVRDYMLTMIRELVEEHDYEGLELDWLRCPFCLNAPAEDVAKVTEWHSQIRALTQARAAKLGKPYPLGLRVPCRLGQLKAVGIDVRGMVDASVIDFVNFSNFFQTTWDVPYDELRQELGEKVAIYGVVEGVPNWLEGGLKSQSQPVGGCFSKKTSWGVRKPRQARGRVLS